MRELGAIRIIAGSAATETPNPSSVRNSSPNSARLMDATSRTRPAAYALPTTSAGASMATLMQFTSGGAGRHPRLASLGMARPMTGCVRREARPTLKVASIAIARLFTGHMTTKTLMRFHSPVAGRRIAPTPRTTFHYAAVVTSCSISPHSDTPVRPRVVGPRANRSSPTCPARRL